MEVEDIAGVCLAARRTLEDERYLTIGDGLLGEVVVYDKGVAAGVAEIFADGDACEGSEESHGCRLRSRGCNHHGVLEGAVLAEGLHQCCDGRSLLTDGHVDTVDGLACLEVLALVDDGVDGDGRLADLAVADDELTLSAADRHHRVDGLQTGLERLGHGLAVDYAGSLALEGETDELAVDRTASVDRLAKYVNDTAQQAFAHGDGGNLAGAAYGHVLGDLADVVHKNNADVAFFKVHGHALDAVLELYKFVGADIVEAVDVSNAVAYFEDSTDFFEYHLRVDVLELLLQYF